MNSNRSLDDAVRKLEAHVNRILFAPERDRVPLAEVFSGSFMRKHTRFDSIRDFVADATVDPPGDEGVTPVIDDFVRGTTQFSSWTEMIQRAELEWLRDHQG